MEKQLIISIGREVGSGGHEIAEILAKHYNIPLLDKNILEDIAAKKNVDSNSIFSRSNRNAAAPASA